MFKTGDKARLKVTFDLIEHGKGYCFDDPEDFDRFVRGDMVEILRIVENTTDLDKDRDLAVVYNPKTYVSTTVAIRHLEPIKSEINIDVPVNVTVDPKKIADALTSLSESVKVVVGDPKTVVKGELGKDMKITSGTITAKDLFKDTSMHVGGMLRGNNKITF
ncbi:MULTISPECIES: hypothetical protein [Bacillus cereus group]|uniref:hypothetical protein n=1 Tax=Bacillus cereus group TaxID=86661 RepID=UPI000BED2B9D|nr:MULTISPECIES: hypothetical protein [Bacillus cereus group]PEF88578.1 hypothetical protein CON51_05075 [Bacillus thuringiensis]PES54755.1 hypothetical protein CN506_19875 [Bacillus thuringiensis]PFP03554.1 hypothetical protein COJ91_22450 [Bacillus thuringiensis]PFS55711.1 hypothetical protein COK64_23485 [Bacillus thuringiensis]PGL62363.1 hypothetical protein CN939_19650 [Bacillus thuringiensis]